MVEGAHVRAARNDPSNDRIQVVQHVSRGDAHHVEPFPFQNRVTNRVPLRLVTEAMRLFVHLNDQPALKASEVGRNLANGKLATEFEPGWPLSKLLPKQNFRQAHLPPQ